MLLIVWHSRTGTAQAMARAAFDGARGEGLCRMLRAEDACGAAGEEAMLGASAYLFCCPENLASASGAMKEFFDRNYYPLLGRIEGRSYATMIAAGTDGSGAERQIDRIATGWRLRRVAEPLIVLTGAQTPEAILAPKSVASERLLDCYNLGQALCAGLMLGVF
jgi:multimeric flavodoxin WrbA